MHKYTNEEVKAMVGTEFRYVDSDGIEGTLVLAGADLEIGLTGSVTALPSGYEADDCNAEMICINLEDARDFGGQELVDEEVDNIHRVIHAIKEHGVVKDDTLVCEVSERLNAERREDSGFPDLSYVLDIDNGLNCAFK